MEENEHSWKPDRKLLSEDKETRALLIGPYLKKEGKIDAQDNLLELESLAKTFGLTAARVMLIPLQGYDGATLIGEGKINELAKLAQEEQIDLVVFDDAITPAQQRNIEELLKKPTIDRVELIIEIFAQRAQTSEAQLQIELAKLRYLYPRLKRMWSHLERQRGVRGAVGGPGEQQKELDRRMLQDEEDKLRRKLKEVQAVRQTQRASRQRSTIPLCAIVGYTNAGKSSLLNALTDAKVFVEDKLFATLDTTSRKFFLPNKQELILIDTVGFIRKLPHHLIEAFRSTLEEALFTDLLIHLIDVSNPSAQKQAEASEELLKELGVDNKKIITVFNKVDREIDREQLARLYQRYPDALEISVLEKKGLDGLCDRLRKELAALRKVLKIFIPYSEASLIAEISRKGTILSKQAQDEGCLMEIDLPEIMHHRVANYLVE